MTDYEDAIAERTEARADLFRAQERVRELEDKLSEWVRCEQDQPVGWLADDASDEDSARGKELESRSTTILRWLFAEGQKIATKRREGK